MLKKSVIRVFRQFRFSVLGGGTREGGAGSKMPSKFHHIIAVFCLAFPRSAALRGGRDQFLKALSVTECETRRRKFRTSHLEVF